MDVNHGKHGGNKKQKKARRSQTHITLGEMWDDVLANNQLTLAHHELGALNALAESIQLLMGWNVEPSDVLGIQGDDIRHIYKNHGIPHQNHKGQWVGEIRKEQLPITKQDFENLPAIFRNPVFTKDTDRVWGEVLIATAKIHGHLTAVMIHAPAKKMLHIKSMRKYK